MNELGHFFEGGGLATWPTLALGVTSCLLALTGALRPTKRTLRLIQSAAVATLLCGSLGFVVGIWDMSSALVELRAHPTDLPIIILAGINEATAGLIIALALLLPTVILAGIGTMRQPQAY